MCAIRTGDPTQLVHTRDECTHEAEVNEGHEECIVLGEAVEEERGGGPDEREDGDDEQHEDEGGRQRVAFHEAVDEP